MASDSHWLDRHGAPCMVNENMSATGTARCATIQRPSAACQ